MQIQKVNSNQNFEGGLVRISPNRFIDVDAIEGLYLKAGDIFLTVVGRKEDVHLGSFGQKAKEVFTAAIEKFERAKRMLSGTTNKTFKPEETRVISTDSIEGILLDDNEIYLDIKGKDTCFKIADDTHLLPDELPKAFEELASCLHSLKAPRGGEIVDLLG